MRHRLAVLDGGLRGGGGAEGLSDKQVRGNQQQVRIINYYSDREMRTGSSSHIRIVEQLQDRMN